MKRYEIAQKYKNEGYNCAQAVALAYYDLTSLSQDEIINITSGFGLGMGNMEATCGALVGANIILGYINTTNVSSTKLAKELSEKFKELSGATICKDLKGIETKIILCPCIDCVKNASLALDYIKEVYNI